MLFSAQQKVDRTAHPITTELTIGRGLNAGLRVDDPAMSRQHARIRAVGGGFVIEDLSSRNGTFVNAVAISAAPLPQGSVIRIGDTIFGFGELPEHAEDDAVLIGRSAAHAALIARCRTVAQTDLPVLIVGESGTGKDLIARRLHKESGREGPLLTVNCGAMANHLIPSQLFGHVRGAFTGADTSAPGLFDEAAGGTLFLDEIGELPLAQQPALLRVLETGDYMPVGSSYGGSRLR